MLSFGLASDILTRQNTVMLYGVTSHVASQITDKNCLGNFMDNLSK